MDQIELGSKNPMSAKAELPSFDLFSKWSPEQLTAHLVKQGVPIGDRFITHRIDGSLVGILTDKDYDKLGFDAIGDMLRVKSCVAVLQKQIKSYERDHVIWEGEMFRDTSCWASCFVCFECCLDVVPLDKYKLSGSNLQVIQFSKTNTNPCLACCYPTQRAVDNIALATVKDVDMNMQKPSCVSSTFCCLKGRAEVILSHMGADVDSKCTTLCVSSDQGMSVQKIIRDAIADNTSKI